MPDHLRGDDALAEIGIIGLQPDILVEPGFAADGILRAGRIGADRDKLILRRGYRQTTLSDIAEDSGVPLGDEPHRQCPE